MSLRRHWLIGVGCFLCANSVQAGSAAHYQSLIQQASVSSGVPAAIITAVIRVESGFRETVISPKGAQGLMQLMPATAQRFGVKDAFDPRQNIQGGSQYLRWLYQRYQHWPLVLAAYNAGEKKVDKYGGIPPYRETRNYVQKVLAHYAKLTQQTVPNITAIAQQQTNTGSTQTGKPMLTTVPMTNVPPMSEAAARVSSVFFVE